jgi:hypothetical protein
MAVFVQEQNSLDKSRQTFTQFQFMASLLDGIMARSTGGMINLISYDEATENSFEVDDEG